MPIRGSVDRIGTKEIVGWAYSPEYPAGLPVQAVLNHEIVGDATANAHRADLANAGLGNGNCGFIINLYREISPIYLPFLSVKVDGGDVELPRSGVTGFSEFFSAIYRTFPSAGRPRSVFGGLWTDRTDAVSMLRGKKEVGHVGNEAETALAPLIRDGIAIVAKAAGAPDEPAPAEPEPNGSLMRDGGILPVLVAAFEDTPTVIDSGTIDRKGTPWLQPSGLNASFSPAECLMLIAPHEGHPVTIETVRQSHRLPEFTASGVSRWSKIDLAALVDFAVAHQGMVDQHTVDPGSVAIVGPGTIFRVLGEDETSATKTLCIPTRAMPIKATNGAANK